VWVVASFSGPYAEATFTPSRIGESTSQIARTWYFGGKVHR